jgi:cystathionine beta-synthase
MIHRLTDAIGNTPLLQVLHQHYASDIYLKLESCNPGGSIKDRVAFRMIEENERQGHIKPGMELVEATSGNTGIGIAWIGKLKGYHTTIVAQDNISPEKLTLLHHLSANVIITHSTAPPHTSRHFRNVARAYANAEGRFYLDQYSSPFNAEAHFLTTAPEIYQQTRGEVGAIVCGIGSGGTLTGLSRYFKKLAPWVQIIGVEPEGSVFYAQKYQTTAAQEHSPIAGIGSDFIPDIYDPEGADDIVPVSHEEALMCCRALYDSDAVDIGLSSGAVVSVAQKIAREGRYKKIVCISPDAGNRYISKCFTA